MALLTVGTVMTLCSVAGSYAVRHGSAADAVSHARWRERLGPRPDDARLVNGREQPPRVWVPRSASGRYAQVAGTASAPRGTGRLVRYRVEVEEGLPFDGREFAAAVHRTLNDRRGWGRGGRAIRFTRVEEGPASFRVALTSPAMTDRMCLPLRTHGALSCQRRSRAIINARRWGQGAASYGGDLASYREYLVSHEVGHLLSHVHRMCPRRGLKAPVMVQQTVSLYGCRANPWPYPQG